MPLSAPPVKVNCSLPMPPASQPPKSQPLRALQARGLKGTAWVPGDKSISQRALILAEVVGGIKQCPERVDRPIAHECIDHLLRSD